MEKINLIKVLKDAPVGLELHSVNHGTVYYYGIAVDLELIITTLPSGGRIYFNPDGSDPFSRDSECKLFPSQRVDWKLFNLNSDHILDKLKNYKKGDILTFILKSGSRFISEYHYITDSIIYTYRDIKIDDGKITTYDHEEWLTDISQILEVRLANDDEVKLFHKAFPKDTTPININEFDLVILSNNSTIGVFKSMTQDAINFHYVTFLDGKTHGVLRDARVTSCLEPRLANYKERLDFIKQLASLGYHASEDLKKIFNLNKVTSNFKVGDMISITSLSGLTSLGIIDCINGNNLSLAVHTDQCNRIIAESINVCDLYEVRNCTEPEEQKLLKILMDNNWWYDRTQKQLKDLQSVLNQFSTGDFITFDTKLGRVIAKFNRFAGDKLSTEFEMMIGVESETYGYYRLKYNLLTIFGLRSATSEEIELITNRWVKNENNNTDNCDTNIGSDAS